MSKPHILTLQKSMAKAKAAIQKGFTLIELVVVLAVVGVLLALAQANFGLLDAFRATGGAQEATQAISKIRECFSSQSSFSGISVARVVDNRCQAYTTRVVTTPTVSVTNEWGGARSFAAANYSGGTNNAFTITEPQVPTSACARFVEDVWSSAAVITVTPNGGAATTVKASPSVQLDGNGGAIATACSGAAPFSIVITATKGT